MKKSLQYEVISQDIPALKRGREKEAEACASYMTKIEKEHTNFVVHSTGLVIDPHYPYLGASPDGSVSCDCCGKRCWKLSVPTNTEVICLHPKLHYQIGLTSLKRMPALKKFTCPSHKSTITKFRGKCPYVM